MSQVLLLAFGLLLALFLLLLGHWDLFVLVIAELFLILLEQFPPDLLIGLLHDVLRVEALPPLVFLFGEGHIDTTNTLHHESRGGGLRWLLRFVVLLRRLVVLVISNFAVDVIQLILEFSGIFLSRFDCFDLILYGLSPVIEFRLLLVPLLDNWLVFVDFGLPVVHLLLEINKLLVVLILLLLSNFKLLDLSG